jgi:hypothetical protein
VTPPQLCIEAAKELDDAAIAVTFDLLEMPDSQPPATAPQDRLSIAAQKIMLPLRHNGLGITSAVRIGPIAWWTSLAATSAVDNDLEMHREGLLRFTAEAHALVLERVPNPNARPPPMLLADAKAAQDDELTDDDGVRPDPSPPFPDDPSELVKGPLYLDFFKQNPLVKFQRHLSHLAHKQAHKLLIRELLEAKTTKQDDKHHEAGTFRAKLLAAIYAPLGQRFHRLTAIDCVIFGRFCLRLPPLPHLGNLQPHDNFDYQVEICLDGHAKGDKSVLDLYLNHARGGCPTANGARNYLHTQLMRVYRFAAKQAGVLPVLEPPTSTLLLGELDPHQCRKLFPKTANAKSTAQTERLLEDQKTAEGLVGQARTDAIDDINRRIDQVPDRDTNQLNKGLRIDIAFENEFNLLDRPRWMDITANHTTCPSHDTKTERACNDETLRLILEGKSRKSIVKFVMSHALRESARKKTVKYNPLIALAHKQLLEGRRQAAPLFVAGACSTFGEPGEDLIKLREWLTKCHKLMVAREAETMPRSDGRKASELSAEFRQNIRHAHLIATARGIARSGLSVGRLKSGCKKFF